MAFTHVAADRGLKVLVDLVANQTSIDHPWFQAARSDPASPYRDWYVWSEEEPENKEEGVVFPGVQHATWTYDEVAGAWYMHRFYQHQADLNVANPAVKAEIERIMGFWLQLGVSGFRVDAVPFLIEHRGLEEHERPKEDPHEYLTDLHDFLAWRRAEAVLLAEANITMDEVGAYFGPNGDRMHLIFNFMLNQNLYLALARGDAEPIRRTMAATPAIPPISQWATFLRNHDELDLGRLTDDERAECYAAFGPEPTMQLYDRGIRRRLAPMLGGDARRLKLAYSLMFALPGTPTLWYGEEIGMGEDLALQERAAVRTPMQWADEPNAAFSTAPPERLVRPVLERGDFAYDRVNVADQRDRPGSLMDLVQRLVRVRRACPEVGWGRCTVLEAGDTAVLALRYDWERGTLVLLHNLADRAVEARLALDGIESLHPLLGDEGDRAVVGAGEPIALGPYGFRWFRGRGERR